MFNNLVDEGDNSADTIRFWFDFLDFIMRVIEDDKINYTAALNQFPQELNVGNLSASCLWNLYRTDLKVLLQGKHPFLKVMISLSIFRTRRNKKFVNTRVYEFVLQSQRLLFQICCRFASVQELDSRVSRVSLNEILSLVILILRWFVPFVMDWLNENDEHSMDILRNAYNRDKADNFPRTSDHTKFSNSVVDVFTQLNEALKLLNQMQCPDPSVVSDMMRRFSTTLNKVL